MAQSNNNGKNRRFLFTSESVSRGHPDKVCDQIADAVLDECLRQDVNSKVACETAVKTGTIWIFGEISTRANIDYQTIARDVVRKIGFNNSSTSFDADTCGVLVSIQGQSPEIAKKVHEEILDPKDIGAGDQGMMFGYATDETPEMMPLSHLLASKLAMKLNEVREQLGWVLPDGKSQVTVEYENQGGKIIPLRVHTVVMSVQHVKDTPKQKIQEDLKNHVIKEVIPAKYLDDKTAYFLNQYGEFNVGGPKGDAGVTGRKVVVDGYGGWGGSGGGAFSGKDPSKVDRSASYCARRIAKSLVAAGLCNRCMIQLSYCIGHSDPLSVFVDSYGTGVKPDEELERIVKANFNLKPGQIVQDLKLLRPIFQQTASFGHFGRTEDAFTWEIPMKLTF